MVLLLQTICSNKHDYHLSSSSLNIKGAKVFCQGSAGVKNAAYDVCKKVGARFYGGRGGAREDLV